MSDSPLSFNKMRLYFAIVIFFTSVNIENDLRVNKKATCNFPDGFVKSELFNKFYPGESNFSVQKKMFTHCFLFSELIFYMQNNGLNYFKIMITIMQIFMCREVIIKVKFALWLFG